IAVKNEFKLLIFLFFLVASPKQFDISSPADRSFFISHQAPLKILALSSTHQSFPKLKFSPFLLNLPSSLQDSSFRKSAYLYDRVEISPISSSGFITSGAVIFHRISTGR